MTFEEFCGEISDNISKYLPEHDIEATKIEKITKNNGVECTGIVILLTGESVAPNIYLDYYFMIYKQGRSLDDILTLISEEYLRAKATVDNSDFNVDVEDIKDNAVIKLVNYERNKDKLEECPYIPYLDLAISFRFLVKLDDCGVASALITNKDLHRMEMTKEELYQLAMDNTRRLFPEKLRCMDEFIPNMEQLCPNKEDRNKLYVLTNEAGVNGATSMLYDGVIRNFAKEVNKSVFIMPSSIHEIILICCDEMEKDRLKALVKEVNKFIVSELEYLSDNVYVYDLDSDKITI